MKKATSKRERKYGKKNEDGVRVSETVDERVVKVMVDHYSILKFKNRDEAEKFINKRKKEAEARGLPETSYIYLN